MQVPIQAHDEQQDELEIKAQDLLARIQAARDTFEQTTLNKVESLTKNVEILKEDMEKTSDDIVNILEEEKKNIEAI
ncbi:MAG: hypothetical protein WC045_02710 [Patescibacteria group bacterium]